jgi:hypothetical protein
MIKWNILSYISGIFGLSKIIEAMRCLEGHGLKEQLQFIVATVVHRDAFVKLTQADGGGPFDRLIRDRSRYVSLVITHPLAKGAGL